MHTCWYSTYAYNFYSAGNLSSGACSHTKAFWVWYLVPPTIRASQNLYSVAVKKTIYSIFWEGQVYNLHSSHRLTTLSISWCLRAVWTDNSLRLRILVHLSYRDAAEKMRKLSNHCPALSALPHQRKEGKEKTEVSMLQNTIISVKCKHLLTLPADHACTGSEAGQHHEQVASRS